MADFCVFVQHSFPVLLAVPVSCFAEESRQVGRGHVLHVVPDHGFD